MQQAGTSGRRTGVQSAQFTLIIDNKVLGRDTVFSRVWYKISIFISVGVRPMKTYRCRSVLQPLYAHSRFGKS